MQQNNNFENSTEFSAMWNLNTCESGELNGNKQTNAPAALATAVNVVLLFSGSEPHECVEKRIFNFSHWTISLAQKEHFIQFFNGLVYFRSFVYENIKSKTMENLLHVVEHANDIHSSIAKKKLELRARQPFSTFQLNLLLAIVRCTMYYAFWLDLKFSFNENNVVECRVMQVYEMILVQARTHAHTHRQMIAYKQYLKYSFNRHRKLHVLHRCPSIGHFICPTYTYRKRKPIKNLYWSLENAMPLPRISGGFKFFCLES